MPTEQHDSRETDRPVAAGSALAPLFVRVAPEQIVYLKFIFESYEDLGVIRTLNAAAGDLVVLALESTVAEATELLNALSSEISLTMIDPGLIDLGPGAPDPDKRRQESDWLLAEHFAETPSLSPRPVTE